MLDKLTALILWPVNFCTQVLSFCNSLIDGTLVAFKNAAEQICYVGVKILLLVLLYQLALGDLLDRVLAVF